MITVDQFMNLKLRRQQGQSVRSTASDTGLARNTVRHVLRGEHSIEQRAHRSKARRTRASKLDPFKEYVQKRVEEFDLSAVRILPEIQSMGYRGGLHTIRRFVSTLKQEQVRAKVATVRFETPPGKQAQCDWGHIGKFPDATGKLVDVYVFVIVLAYSRQQFVCFTTSMKIPALIECHQRAFEYFQGVPQTILYDNMSQVRTAPGRLNAQFADFAAHYAFEVKTHRPYRPRTKGKVERMVDYVKGNFLNGREFAGLEDLNVQGQQWLEEVANVRIHRTTGQPPRDLWLQEKDQLIALDRARPYVLSVREDRKVAADTFVSFNRSRYSVPPTFIGKPVEIVALNGTIQIRCADAIIAEHLQANAPGQTIMNHEHIEELWRMTLDRVPLRGTRHCNVRLDESVDACPLSRYEEVTP